jgi:hypothetical protein
MRENDFHERPGRSPGVAALWSFGAVHATSSLIAADGCFDLIVRTNSAGHARATVYTPVTTAHLATVPAGTRVVGVRVKPGAGGALTGPGAAVLQRPFADNGVDADELEALVAECVETWPAPSVVTDFVLRARETRGGLRALHLSRARTLQRACRRWLGLRPKTFLRIERAWAARTASRAGQPLAAIAADLGYSDQAHLSRELRVLLGVTPRSLRAVGNLQDPSTSHR